MGARVGIYLVIRRWVLICSYQVRLRRAVRERPYTGYLTLNSILLLREGGGQQEKPSEI